MLAGFRSRWITLPRARLPAPPRSASRSAALHRQESALRDPVSQGRSLHQFQHQRPRPLGFLDAVYLGDVRVVQAGEDLRLPREPGEPIRVIREGVGQDLQRDLAVELRVGVLLHPLVVVFAVERQCLDAHPARLLIEPAPGQQQPHRVGPIVDGQLPHHVKRDPKARGRLEPALAGPEFLDADVMRGPVVPVDEPARRLLLVQHTDVVREPFAAVLVVVDQPHLTRS